MATNYDINYDDQRFKEVESDKKVALTENEKLYSGMIENSDKYYQAQIDASKQWADKQSQLQQEKTDFAIEKIEQQKDQAKKDYTKEQSGAYVDWQKQSNQYGVNAEQMAAQGLQNSGYSESSQVSMYNTYQNRVYTARETYNQIVMNFNNSIKDAQLQNNSILAEIAFEAQQKQLELNLQGFQHKNQLLLEQANKKLEIDNHYYNRYQDVLDQINKENALAEEIRQYNEKMAEEKRQYDATLAEQKRQHDESLAEQKRQHDESLAEEKRQFDAQMALKSSSSGGGGGSSGGSSRSSSGGSSRSSSGGSSSSSSSGGGGYNNGGYSTSTVKKAQQFVGASADGMWGANSAAAAKRKGYSSLAAVVAAMGGGGGDTPVNTKSVINLGYGRISGSKLAELEERGEIKSTVKNGQVTFSHNVSKNVTKALSNPVNELLRGGAGGKL